MDETTSPVPEPVSPELAAIDAYLTDALRVPPLDTEAARVMAQAVMRREVSAGGGRIGKAGLGNQTLRGTQGKAQAQSMWLRGGFVVVAALVILFLGWPRISTGPGITQVYKTTTGHQATITLPDGTRITLAPQTTLRLTNFGSRSRTVQLEGEAYFEIPHAAGIPFIVRSGSAATRVLGTKFTVRDYPDDRRARIAVTTGKVTVLSTTARFAAVTLTAGHLGDIADSTITVKATKTSDELAQETSWLHGRLVFHDAPVPEVLAMLKRWYGYQFRCSDSSVMRQDLTVALSTQSSSAALAILEQVLNVDLMVRGDTVDMIPRRSRPAHGTTRTRSYDLWTPNKEAGR